MQPSSLVFVAIIAGWAVLLLPHWVSRREAVGQSRGADRDSTQLRVLSRRPTATPQDAPHRSTSPLLTVPVSRSAAVGSAAHTLAHPPAGRVSPQRVSAPHGAQRTAGRGPGLVGRVDRTARRSAAARRARLLMTLSVVALTSWGIVALPGVPWPAAVPATALLVLDVAGLVVGARRRATERRVAARRLARTVAGAQRSLAQSRRVDRPVASTLPEPRADRGDGAAHRPVAADVAVHEDQDDTWTPVPVPVPTYLLKPVVPRRPPPPLEGEETAPAGSAASVSGGASTAGSPVGPTSVPAAPSPVADPAAQTPPRPWEVEHTWADDLDLFLARRRAVNG